jgi:hypothetical protein
VTAYAGQNDIDVSTISPIQIMMGHVRSIYKQRKAWDPTYYDPWYYNASKTLTNSYYIMVSEDEMSKPLGTMKLDTVDKDEKSPTERFLQITTTRRPRTEIGMLTVDKSLNEEQRNAVVLELWLHLVNHTINKYGSLNNASFIIFADKAGSLVYRYLGFRPIKRFFDEIAGMDVEYLPMVEDRYIFHRFQLHNADWVAMEQTFTSPEDFRELLSRSSKGKLTFDSELVQQRLEDLGLLLYFREIRLKETPLVEKLKSASPSTNNKELDKI